MDDKFTVQTFGSMVKTEHLDQTLSGAHDERGGVNKAQRCNAQAELLTVTWEHQLHQCRAYSHRQDIA